MRRNIFPIARRSYAGNEQVFWLAI
jgi:hypothetical protein